jgi:hypothetical protein
LLAHFRLDYRRADLARMREVARFDAKEPARLYADDSEAKRRMATPGIRAAADSLLAPLRDRLDALRLNRAAAWG